MHDDEQVLVVHLLAVLVACLRALKAQQLVQLRSTAHGTRG